MVVEVFVAAGQREDALSDQLFNRMLDVLRISGIYESVGQSAAQTEMVVNLPQQ